MPEDYKLVQVSVQATLDQIVQGILASPEGDQYNSFERVCEALKTGKLVSPTETLGLTLNAATARLWQRLKSARAAKPMINVQMMTDGELAGELAKLEREWDASRADDEEGHGGSPGEWMVERMDELAAEQKRRRTARIQGYRVKSTDDLYVHRTERGGVGGLSAKSPVTSKADAYRLMADWLDAGYTPVLVCLLEPKQ